MNELVSELLWRRIKKLANQRGPRHAAIAYVASDAHLAFRSGDVLVTDASDATITGAQTSARVLKAAHARGAELYSLCGLHAKVICFGRHVVIGSANASSSSVTRLVEAGVVSDDPRLRAEARAFIAQLKESATPIDKAFLRRVAAIPVNRSARPAGVKPKVKDHKARMWLASVNELQPEAYESDSKFIERGEDLAAFERSEDDSDISWIRYTGSSRFRREASPGDCVIQIWRESASKKVFVWEPAALLVRRNRKPHSYFHIEELRGSEQRAVPWRKFQKDWRRLVGTASPSVNGARLLRDDVADVLGQIWRR